MKKKKKKIIHKSPTQTVFDDGTSKRHKRMENREYAKHLTPKEKVDLVQKDEEKNIEMTEVEMREFKPRFLKIRAYQLFEDSTIHCSDGNKLFGKTGDYYVSLDMVKEFILPEQLFRKLFIAKINED